jgi:hypothetical protein
MLSGSELNDRASASLDKASGIREGFSGGTADIGARVHLGAAGQTRMAADALSNLLRTVRLTGATFFDIAARDS